jgi:hypothetical protein
MDWQEAQKLFASDGSPADRFGSSVALGEGTAIVGAYQDSNGGSAVGSAYFFKQNSLGSWHQSAKLLASDAAASDAMGFSVAAGGGIGLVGAPLSNTGAIDAGAAYLFNAPAGISGDYNQDGTVNAADFVVWRDTAGQTGDNLAADGNGDGIVNEADNTLWRANFGLSAPANPATFQGAAVPELGTIMLLELAVLLLLSRPSRP